MIIKKLICAFIVCLATTGSFAKRVLIYTHNGKGYVHENIAASVEAIKKVCAEIGYEADASDDPAVFTKDNLAKYACIIFSNTNNEAFDTETQREAFANFIRAGGAFVGVHCASASERQWPWYWAMIGGKFVRHPDLQKFTVKVIDRTHSSTSFLADTFEWEDECYFLDNLNPDIHILLAADLRSIKDEEKDKYPGKVFGDYAPLAWCHEYDGGRQFYTALGHKSEHYKDPLYLKHLLGGIKWALKEN